MGSSWHSIPPGVTGRPPRVDAVDASFLDGQVLATLPIARRQVCLRPPLCAQPVATLDASHRIPLRLASLCSTNPVATSARDYLSQPCDLQLCMCGSHLAAELVATVEPGLSKCMDQLLMVGSAQAFFSIPTRAWTGLRTRSRSTETEASAHTQRGHGG